MNIKDVKPLNHFVEKEAAHVVLFGGPGTAKTPLCAELSSQLGWLYLIVESGIKSAREHKGPAYKAANAKDINEFFAWWFTSKDALQFPGIVLDSISKIAKFLLADAESKTRHGMQAYGMMAEQTMKIVDGLVADKNRHCLMISQLFLEERTVKHGLVESVTNYHRPLFPGKRLDKDFAHEIDEVWYAHHTTIPGVGNTVAILTRGNDSVLARTRDGRLQPLEPPNLVDLIKKITT